MISKKIEKIDNNSIKVGANVPCTMLAKQCIRWGMAPSEFFSGIPGSIGGALAMNAGAYGHETWERVDSVKIVDRLGGYHTRKPSEYKINYRSVVGPPDEWFISANLIFDPNKSSSLEKQKEMLSKRKNSQPLGKPSCGSVFRNPEGNFAAKLIQDSGLKGFRIGGAHISTKHANFIINDQKEKTVAHSLHSSDTLDVIVKRPDELEKILKELKSIQDDYREKLGKQAK